ncbi:MAG: patatin-like phospholipase family protein [Bryobacteraceae bacterium]|nr:patatin-like phospholipase family protein [Bryobacteraceae bacterium]
MRVALVLSAGGMFGAYQLGAWEVLEEFLRPDLVIGTSIGSLHAWAIAGGASAAQLADLWYDPSLAHAVRWQVPFGLRQGLLQTDALEQRIRQLHGSFTPQRPVGIVANAYPFLRPHLFRDQEITWEHLAASCAVPLFLRQPQLGAHTYADGGLFDSLNVWAAFALGATHAVVVNCWKPTQPWLLDKSVGWLAARRRRAAKSENNSSENRVVLIEPSGSLGPIRQSIYWQQPLVDAWRQQGKSDALRNKQIICDMF